MLAAMCSECASTRGHNGAAVAREAHIAKRCEGLKGRGMSKKKARRTSDAPSNKTYGNCLLGLHCSQNGPAANRARTRFRAVAELQQRILSTGYPQTLVDVLGIAALHRCRCLIRQNRSQRGSDSSGPRQQSAGRRRMLARTNIEPASQEIL